jgi:hypothetical protein
VIFTFMTTPAQPIWLQVLGQLGPVATLVAAGVAGWLAYRLQQLQKAIGQSQVEVAQASKEVAKLQADIAFDKLKLDLFNRRFDLYTEALKITADIFKQHQSGGVEPISYERLDKLNEAAFIFSPDAANRIETIRAAAENIGIYRARLETMKQQGSPNLEAQEKLIAIQVNALMAAGANLRQAIKHDMSFVHLLSKAQ